MNKLIIGVNDLKTVYPQLIDEWNYEKNKDITPDKISAHNGRSVWWKCGKCGYEWQTKVSNRANGNGCPRCSGRIASNNSILSSKAPKLVREWNYVKNGELTPDKVAYGSHKKVWWVCDKGHEWEAEIKSRASGRGCPVCANLTILPGYNDLKTLYPELVNEWNYEKNSSVSPDKISAHTNKKVWWKCNSKHEWQATVASRVSGNGCPICANQLVLPGYNDLETKNPELAKEWNYEKNIDKKPTMYMPNSNKTVWWKCRKCGYEWQAVISNRNFLGRGCPKCAKDLQISFPEYAIVFYLHPFFPDIEQTNTTVIGKELDIYIPSKKIAIEYDGVHWHKTEKKQRIEIEKNRICSEKGISLFRIRENGLCLYNDCNCIIREDNNSDEGLNKSLEELFSLLGLSEIKPDVEKDRANILKESIQIVKRNSLQARYPEVAMEWDYDKNQGLKPDMVASKSNHMYWWKCSLGHEWKASPNSRTSSRKCGCPYCSNHRVLTGFNDLATLHPELVKEWNFSKNLDIDPKQIVAGSNKKVWWKCPTCGNEWEAIVATRTKGKNPTGCKICGKEKMIASRIKNRIESSGSLLSNNMLLSLEWNYKKNNGMKPEMFLPNSNVKVWWKCSQCGNEWETTINNRNKGKGCPICSRKRSGAKRGKRIINEDTQEIFDSITLASEKFCIGPSALSACCRGRQKTAGGYHWKYLK